MFLNQIVCILLVCRSVVSSPKETLPRRRRGDRASYVRRSREGEASGRIHGDFRCFSFIPLSLHLPHPHDRAPTRAPALFPRSSFAYERRDAATLRLTTDVLPPPRIEIDAPPPPRRASPPSTFEGGAEGRGGPRSGGGREKSHPARGWILRYEPLCEVLGVVREEFSFIGVYTRGETPLYSRTGCAASTYTSTRAHPLCLQLSSYASTRTRARVQRSRMQSAPRAQSSRIADSRNGGAPPPPSRIPPPVSR